MDFNGVIFALDGMKHILKKVWQILQMMHYYKLALNKVHSRLSVHDLELLMTNGEDGK
jgi:DNA integrity scanning protein DisA with diadenylate cyclase activity